MGARENGVQAAFEGMGGSKDKQGLRELGDTVGGVAEPDKASLGKMYTKKPQILQAMDTEPLSGPLSKLKWSAIWLGPETGKEKCSESWREVWQLRILPSAQQVSPEIPRLGCGALTHHSSAKTLCFRMAYFGTSQKKKKGLKPPGLTQMYLEGIILKEIRQTHTRLLHGSTSMRDLEWVNP